jgi:hypothetical protein
MRSVRRYPRLLVLPLTTIMLSATMAYAGATPAVKCEVAKTKASGKAFACLSIELAKQAAGGTPDFAKCETKLATAFVKAETKAGPGVCPTTGDASDIGSRLDAATAGITAELAGTRFVDNADGTVTDTQTGLQWEQKTADGSVHDVDIPYTWCRGEPGFTDGTVFSPFLNDLNDCTTSDGTTLTATGFAGHCDWRLPTLAELETIVDTNALLCGVIRACIDPVFGPTRTSNYWSQTRVTAEAGGIYGSTWSVDFFTGSVGSGPCTTPSYVRAVRSGS